MDFSAFQRRNVEVEEHWLMPRYEEAQFVAAAREAGLRVEPRADGLWRIEALIEEGFPQDRIERIGLLKLDSDIRAHKIADEATGEVFVKRIEVKGRLRGQPVRLITNEWYEAQQLADTYWLYVVWSPFGDSRELVRIYNPVAKLNHTKREIAAPRFYEIPEEAIDQLRIHGGQGEIH